MRRPLLPVAVAAWEPVTIRHSLAHTCVIVLTNLQGSAPITLAMGVAQVFLPDLNSTAAKQ